METRKLQRVGGGTYTVSVPKRWAVERGLDAGTEVRLYAHADGSIVVRSSERDGAALEGVALDVDGDDAALVRRLLRAAYATGYERVTLTPRDSLADGQLRAARETNRGLVGTEVAADTADEFALHSVLETADVSVRQTVVQLRFVARSALRQAAVAFCGDRDADLERLRERAAEADRLFEMVARHLNRSLVSMAELDRLGVDRPALFDYYVTARELTAVADLSVTVAETAGDSSAAIGDRLVADLEATVDDAEALVAAAATAVLEGASATDAHEVLADRDEVTAGLDNLEAAVFDDSDASFDGTAADARALTRLLDALGRIADHSAEIGTVAMRAAMRPDAE
ncbi:MULTISPECIES: AbrB/MazE/SpoVT family DNA-binding domain-containing protein [Halorubrum]|uniref:Phosphate uptake regulator PhoU n=1 Tax=Halorubrum ruber TaxID=2982524 RepID=A0A8T8LPC9_9EURY|nr:MULTISPECIES: phosphate uptake regulator PhoU [Halorubrum]QUO48808.1 phosphate uptake regulator PhoU [Halorubrum ruber]